jgi:hypothetical protein
VDFGTHFITGDRAGDTHVANTRQEADVTSDAMGATSEDADKEDENARDSVVTSDVSECTGAQMVATSGTQMVMAQRVHYSGR